MEPIHQVLGFLTFDRRKIIQVQAGKRVDGLMQYTMHNAAFNGRAA